MSREDFALDVVKTFGKEKAKMIAELVANVESGRKQSESYNEFSVPYIYMTIKRAGGMVVAEVNNKKYEWPVAQEEKKE